MTREEARNVFIEGFAIGIIKELEQDPCEDWYDVPSDEMTLEQARKTVKDLRKKLAEYLTQEPCEDAGEVSDGYHTFNELYHQRAILFAAIVNQNTDIAWKSYKHSDGKYCFDSNGEWFIVGVDTPEGSYTYHYSKEYWDYFECKELDCGKEWDGHTEEDVTRLLSLKQEPCEDAISRQAVLDEMYRRKGNGDAITAGFIRDLPPVTPQPKWIPVSERLPEESLNSVIGWDMYRERCVFVQYINSCFQITGSDESFDIVAWMPLPAPYKAESEDTE